MKEFFAGLQQVFNKVAPFIGRVAGVMITVIIVIGVTIFGIPGILSPLTGELQMAMVVVLAISALLLILFLTAVGYSAYNLADSKQALGLPEGSIRALIALFLIMIFIIMSIYLFRNVADQRAVTIPSLSSDQMNKLENQNLNFKKNIDGGFDVTLNNGITATGEQLALQLATVLGTLVTAVSAFYFGSSTTSSAFTGQREKLSSASLSILSVEPSRVQQSALASPIWLTVIGTGFSVSTRILLNQSISPNIEASEVQIEDSTRIRCAFKLKGSSTGKFNLWVLGANDSAAFKADALEIIS